MFRLTREPISIADHARAIADPHSGGYVDFRGCVRNHHLGRDVRRLHYDVYELLAISEGQRIVDEALARFDIDAVSCIHRVGDLEVGETAVWVGVGAAHRDAAFAACRYVIDEIKNRVPIWKHEFYADGTSSWVGCDGCSHAHGEHRYRQQTAVPGVGSAGQTRLSEAHVLIVGVGALGCPVADALVGAGVGRVSLVDGDHVELSNLHRQGLYVETDAGAPKVDAARRRLVERNSSVRVDGYASMLDEPLWRRLIDEVDLVLECTDSADSKCRVSRWCKAASMPVIVGGVHQLSGGFYVSPLSVDQGVCWDCLSGLSADCGQAGVLGPTPMMIGAAMAGEALRRLMRMNSPLTGRWTVLDLAGGHFASFEPASRPGCTCLSPANSDSGGVERTTLDPSLIWLDLRTDAERVREPLPDAIPVSPDALLSSFPLDANQAYLLVCARGRRSGVAARALRDRGLQNVWSLAGGTEAANRSTSRNLPLKGVSAAADAQSIA